MTEPGGGTLPPSASRLVDDVRSRVDPDGMTDSDVVQWIALVIASSPRIALSKAEAAESLGVSVEFFDRHIEADLRVVRRGRKLIFPLGELLYWMWRASDPPRPPRPARR